MSIFDNLLLVYLLEALPIYYSDVGILSCLYIFSARKFFVSGSVSDFLISGFVSNIVLFL
jgi:hypothetical protein